MKVFLRTVFSFILLEAAFFVFSLASLFSKMASSEPMITLFKSPYLFLSLAAMAFYALFWQQALKRFSLTVAYSNRGIVYLWVVVWASVFFREAITVFNIIGLTAIMAGIVLVTKHD